MSKQATHIRLMNRDILVTEPDTIRDLIESVKKHMPDLDPSEGVFYQSGVEVPLQPEPVDADKLYCDYVARYLASHYMNGIWEGGPIRPWMNKTDKLAMESGYKSAVKFAVDKFESSLWLEVKRYIGLSKCTKKPTRERVIDILKYKTIGKTKNAIRRYLYER